MTDGYRLRAAGVMLRHPLQGTERVRGRIDRRGDLRRLAELGVPLSDFYEVRKDWAEHLHAELDLPWPCEETATFQRVWAEIIDDLTSAGLRVGVRSYGGWNDGDQAFGQAIWCLVAHGRPGKVVETGVAHGLTSRVILTGLMRNGTGHLWSVDLPAVDSALHSEIGTAVTPELRRRWTYVEGTSRERLPGLLADLGPIDLFVHDSLHTGRNQWFELTSAWAALRQGGVAVMDDVDHSLAFRTFVDHHKPESWLAAEHVTGPGLAGSAGLWGLAIKGRASTAGPARTDVKASPHYRAVAAELTGSSRRDHRHSRIELAAIRVLATLIRELPAPGDRFLQIQAHSGQETLLFADQLRRPVRPVIYGDRDDRDDEAKAGTDFEPTDLEKARFSARDGYFDVVVWNRDLVTIKNAVPALREVRRVLKPGGLLLLSAPNLAALHNRLLLLAGRQPTTLHIGNGDHVRGFAATSMTRLLEGELSFSAERVVAVGLAPLFGSPLPRPLSGIGHTIIWALRKAEC
jgi:hypothetical protein